jgi:hypothetical protein
MNRMQGTYEQLWKQYKNEKSSAKSEPRSPLGRGGFPQEQPPMKDLFFLTFD